MKQTNFLFSSITGAAIAMAMVLPAAAESTDACVDITDRTEKRACIRAQWQTGKTNSRSVRASGRANVQAIRTNAKATAKETRSVNKTDRQAALAECAAMRASVTVTDGMVALADVEAVITCYKTIAAMAKEDRQEMNMQRKETKQEVRTTRSTTRSEVRNSRIDTKAAIRGARRGRGNMNAQLNIRVNRWESTGTVDVDTDDEDDMDDDSNEES